MPLLVYECPECGAKVERLKLRREKVGRVPKCHVCGEKMKRVKYPGCNFELKGEGWTK